MYFLINTTTKEFAAVGESDPIEGFTWKREPSDPVVMTLDLIFNKTWDLSDKIKLVTERNIRARNMDFTNVETGERLGVFMGEEEEPPLRSLPPRLPSPNPTLGKVSPYNDFIREELARIREENPGITHKEAYKEAVANWKSSK